MSQANNGPYVWIKTVGTQQDYKKKYRLRDRQQKEELFKDLLWADALNANDIAKGLFFAESKFWRGKSWRILEKERKNMKQ